MKQLFIYKLTLEEKYHDPKAWNDSVNLILSSHAEYLKIAAQRGEALIVGRTDVELKNNFGIVIFYAKNQNEAEVFMRHDPAVKEGLMRAACYPFKMVFLNEDAIRALV